MECMQVVVFRGANGLQLVQSATDSLLWTGVATVVSGSGPNYYAFFNSPNSGSDWVIQQITTIEI